MLFSLFLLAPLGDSEALPRWYPDGPSFKFFPYPVIDEERPWGGECEGCGGKCTGHFITDVDKLLQRNESAKTVRALPPSVLIEEAFKKQQTNSSTCQKMLPGRGAGPVMVGSSPPKCTEPGKGG